jgi:SH3 domain-containing YSC84-like protein 1
MCCARATLPAIAVSAFITSNQPQHLTKYVQPQARGFPHVECGSACRCGRLFEEVAAFSAGRSFFNPALAIASADGRISPTQGHRIRGISRECGKEKMNMKKALASVCLSLLLSVTAFAASSREDLQDRVDSAKLVLDQIMRANDRTVPSNILKSATCVAVVPGMVKGAFLVGAQYGQGVVTCRTGHGWSAPVFIRMAGGSFGFQIGGQATDLILIAVNDRGFQDLLKDKFKIGGDASAAAGPVGRAGTASTDWKMNAELLSYSRAKGLFAGIDLDGTSVSQNRDDTEIYYGEPHQFESILQGDVPVPPGAVAFVRDVANYFVRAKAGAN